MGNGALPQGNITAARWETGSHCSLAKGVGASFRHRSINRNRAVIQTIRLRPLALACTNVEIRSNAVRLRLRSLTWATGQPPSIRHCPLARPLAPTGWISSSVIANSTACRHPAESMNESRVPGLPVSSNRPLGTTSESPIPQQATLGIRRNVRVVPANGSANWQNRETPVPSTSAHATVARTNTFDPSH
jgi:hypothetical protein